MHSLGPEIRERLRSFELKAPDQVSAADIIYAPTDEGWLYPAVVMDLFSRRVIGWALPRRMTQQLAVDTLMMALLQAPTGVGPHCALRSWEPR